MGIDLWNTRFLCEAWRVRGDFGSMLQMGRQELHMPEHDFDKADEDLRTVGQRRSYREVTSGRRWADEGLFQALGASEVQCADASAYEGANIVHDFNDPIDTAHHQRYDTIFDGGSLEHIFNVPTVLANEMAMLKVGGWLIAALPANNWLGHGFYQFSPELPFRVFTPENGFTMEAAFFSEMREDGQLEPIEDLARRAGGEIGTTGKSTSLYYIVKKIAHVKPFRRWPQQGDYSRAWDAAPPEKQVERAKPEEHKVRRSWLNNIFG